ncbi:MAG: DUF1361 domain-containing protein, partial [Anaerolineae bacterium]
MMKTETKLHWILFLALVAASAGSVALLAARVTLTGRITYAFLVWNLILAWAPLLFAWLASAVWEKRPYALAFLFFWLLFFPNAPYIVTDFIHLRWSYGVPRWFDVALIGSFAATGMALGVFSLRLLQNRIAASYGRAAGRWFVLTAVGLSSYGIYLGRFLRWNSWDLFANPLALLQDVAHSLTMPFTFYVSLSLTAVTLAAYVMFTWV